MQCRGRHTGTVTAQAEGERLWQLWLETQLCPTVGAPDQAEHPWAKLLNKEAGLNHWPPLTPSTTSDGDHTWDW